MDVAVVIATTNRQEETAQLLDSLTRQDQAPRLIVISAAASSDVPCNLPAQAEVILGPPGLTLQRNRGLDRVLGQCDVVVFFDDDFLPVKTSLSAIAHLFETYPDIVSATGEVLDDGVNRGGISYADALCQLAAFEQQEPKPVRTKDILWAYGCNMAFRASAIGSLRFDESLPLHGWQEDMDFVTRLAKCGRVVKTTAFAGVHRGVNKGRSPGRPLGFAQIVNPVYLVRKGAMTSAKAATLIIRNLLANHIKTLFPEPFIDRRGRAIGNWIGLFHVLTGRADPTAVLRLH